MDILFIWHSPLLQISSNLNFQSSFIVFGMTQQQHPWKKLKSCEIYLSGYFKKEMSCPSWNCGENHKITETQFRFCKSYSVNYSSWCSISFCRKRYGGFKNGDILTQKVFTINHSLLCEMREDQCILLRLRTLFPLSDLIIVRYHSGSSMISFGIQNLCSLGVVCMPFVNGDITLEQLLMSLFDSSRTGPLTKRDCAESSEQRDIKNWNDFSQSSKRKKPSLE